MPQSFATFKIATKSIQQSAHSWPLRSPPLTYCRAAGITHHLSPTPVTDYRLL